MDTSEGWPAKGDPLTFGAQWRSETGWPGPHMVMFRQFDIPLPTPLHDEGEIQVVNLHSGSRIALAPCTERLVHSHFEGWESHVNDSDGLEWAYARAHQPTYVEWRNDSLTTDGRLTTDRRAEIAEQWKVAEVVPDAVVGAELLRHVKDDGFVDRAASSVDGRPTDGLRFGTLEREAMREALQLDRPVTPTLGRRAWAGEIDYGSQWAPNDRPNNKHRLSWHGTTGELSLTRLRDGHRTSLAFLGSESQVDRLLEGWAQHCPSPTGFAWLRSRLSSHRLDGPAGARNPLVARPPSRLSRTALAREQQKAAGRGAGESWAARRAIHRLQRVQPRGSSALGRSL